MILPLLSLDDADRYLEAHAIVDDSPEWQRCSGAYFCLVRAWMHSKDRPS